jgi:protein SCO1
MLAAKSALLLSVALVASACEKTSAPEAKSPFHYQVRGQVRGLPPDHKTIDVEHEDIPGFMPSMTMPFEVRDEKEIAGLNLGDAIAFRLNVTQRDSWIDQVTKIESGQLRLPRRASTSPPPETATSERLHEGDAMPDFKLTDQDGKPVTLETFRGRPFVLTFIFTRCPIPNFCPRMSSNFADLQKVIDSASGPLAATRLLSVSFDPEHDTPEVLQQYGQHAGADFAIWTFATGTPPEIQGLTKGFSVLVQPESGTISHSLATALVGRDGKIAKIWRGNAWTSGEVVSELDQRP